MKAFTVNHRTCQAIALASMVVGAFLIVGDFSIGHANIAGSSHDFSSAGWSGNRICRPCHTPHGATTNVDSPLWNHSISTASYVLYTSTTMSPGQPTQQPGPGNVSRLCLSCHDGTIAIDAFNGGASSVMISGDANLTTNLADDHPIGMQWAHQTTTPDCSNCHDLRNPGFNPGPVKFPEGRVECSSCHDAHNKQNLPRMLVKTAQGSALCLHCHRK